MDPAKGKTTAKMPTPTDKAGVQGLLGMVQHLSKFLLSLADLTKPLRDLTLNDTDWCWEETQILVFNAVKQAVGKAPVLRYCSLDDKVTNQCDAS